MIQVRGAGNEERERGNRKTNGRRKRTDDTGMRGSK